MGIGSSLVSATSAATVEFSQMVFVPLNRCALLVIAKGESGLMVDTVRVSISVY